MRFRIASVLGLAVLLTAATTAHSFDGRRDGFVLGFGVGPALTSFTQTVTAADGTEMWTGGKENEFGFGLDIKIGAGIGNRFLLYCTGRASWFSFDVDYDALFENSTGLVGLNYYFQDASPSFYVLGLAGLSSWIAPLEHDWDVEAGFGAGAGLGWEFSRHWSLEATVNWGDTGSDAISSEDLWRDPVSDLNVAPGPWSFLITINGLAY